ncbi:MAG: hypothetical protein IJZ36_04800 [Bacilli bacterium]|nr:hypothetical protein [Bacilli bacterium]
MEYINKHPKIYILSGKAESGKDLVGDYIKDIYKDKKTIKLAYATPLKEYAKNIIGYDEFNKPRTFLQEIGIDLIKNKIDDKFLIKRLMDDIKVYQYFFDIIIITDARFKEEIEEVKNNFFNTTTIRINSKDNKLTEKQKNHITEKALDNYDKYDYIIENTSNKDNLYKDILKIVRENNE